jgi:hypothetical protein
MLQQVSYPCLPLPTRLPFRISFKKWKSITYMPRATDKDFIVVEGATTGVTPCTNCANPAASYDNVTKNFFDYAAKWINDRFSSN